jgi:hypothetical protein
MQAALGSGLGSGPPTGYREGCTAHSTDTENPAKYRPQVSKSVLLQSLYEVDNSHAHRPQEQSIDR